MIEGYSCVKKCVRMGSWWHYVERIIVASQAVEQEVPVDLLYGQICSKVPISMSLPVA